MTQTLKNDRLIRALYRQPVDQTPVWLMRQAGRYLPEYRHIRKQVKDFMSLVKNPELACQVTLQPVDRFPLDAAILFSDILTIPQAMGMSLQFVEQEGPVFADPLRTEAAIEALHLPDVETELSYVMDAIHLIKGALNQRLPLIGFSGSPWTLATYMIEGGKSQNFSMIKGMRYQRPLLLEQLLEKLTVAVSQYLIAQIRAGVDVVMLFDTWGGVLTPADYLSFSLTPMRNIIHLVRQAIGDKKIPIVLFTKNGGQWINAIADSGCDAIGIDWTTSLATAKKQVGARVALQGNLDPAALYGSPKAIAESVSAILAEFGAAPGHVFNLGHGIYPDINPDHVAAFVDAVHNLSIPYHQQGYSL